ncbi:CinA family protein [Kushneria indalinina]|uniref:Nicotinamide-nucleotide amidase n=1 Tax=Kushneria indalinina DSM 14324 TaxID=1122140 RepID=A0A3D9DXL6_9GAMM|nr:nicotinamide-nucleotide amidohydrolase family protein [Kushneria indalinina]REC95527.1 nicotinamide-nucleotide amidase [Kushneria indalinina DSM 14324]
MATASGIQELASRLCRLCQQQRVVLTTAESCTGGGVARAITDVAGSSACFETGYITYANSAKQRLLGVSSVSLELFGAVSETVVHEMVRGACRDSGADLGVAISGVAGPGGGTPDKPVGTVWLAWGNATQSQARCYQLNGERLEVRREAVALALKGLVERLEENSFD